MLQVVIGLRYTLRRESIGFYHVCTSLKIAPVNILHDIGTGKTQHIIVAGIQLLDKLSYIHKQSDRNTPRPTPVLNKIN